jgi:catechol 2,3-dioxygenase-like lactoylglutathione lyase family enzyme
MSFIERIDTVCIKVRNIEESSLWYQEKLGFKVVYQGESYRVLSISDSSIPLTIEQENDTTSRSVQTYPIFFTKNIKETYRSLKEKGVNCGEIQIDGVNNFFDFYDIDSNKLQVCFWE